MSAPAAKPPMVVDAEQAVELLRAAGPKGTLPAALAQHLAAVAAYWQRWLPSDPTEHDKTALALIQTVIVTYRTTTTTNTKGK